MELLGREHAELERVFRALAALLDDLEAGTHVSRSELASVVEYVTLFGDLSHHDKEESLLVPVLIQHGFDWYDGPLARMRRDHRQERYLVRVLSDLASQEKPWSSEDQRHLLGVGREYIAFMRGHMARENADILGPAQERLSKEAKAHLSAEFRRFDAEHVASTDYAAKREQIDTLLQKHSHC
jgi:hemerythrin-like domain-containing protein